MRLSVILMYLGMVVMTKAFGASGELNPVPVQPTAMSTAELTRIIVKLRTPDALDESAVAALARRAGLTLKASRRITGSMHVIHIKPTVPGESLAETIAQLRADPAVAFAEADQRRYAHAIQPPPDDPLYNAEQWYLQNAVATPSAVDAATAWDTTTGSNGVVIATLDTGVRFDHPDLLRAGAGGRLLPGYDFITDALTANDGDGRDPDPSDPGDWVSQADANTAAFAGCTVSDSSWHGTRVAGILGAITNNSTGIAGITWSSLILPVRVLGKCGGYDSDIQDAMLWAAGQHVAGVPDNPYPAAIENLSLGSQGACPQSYQDVIKTLTSLGVLVVVSAGNEGGPVDAPANCLGVAGVAGLRQAGTKVGFSSLGPEIALSAPAGNCVNISAGQPCLYQIETTFNLGTTTPGINAYTDQINNPNLGTSFSAPIVSGIAALMKAVNGNLNSTQLIARLREGATTFPVSSDPTVPNCHVPANSTDLQTAECNCTTQTCGAGMANAPAAVAAALRPIAAVEVPPSVSVSSGQYVMLQGGGSAAACNHTLNTYSWTIVNGSDPSGITNANTATATVAAPSSGSFTVRLTVTDDAGRQDTADVVVGPSSATTTAPASAGVNACPAVITVPSPVAVSVSPGSATLQASTGTQAFTAAVTNTPNTAVIWQVDNITGGTATVGTISASGIYKAPATVPSPATVTVSAVLVADASRTGSVQVTITPPTAASGGGGGGSIDLITLLAGMLAVAKLRRSHN